MSYSPLDKAIITSLKMNGAHFLQENVPHFLDETGFRNLIELPNGTLLSLNKSKYHSNGKDKWEAWSESTDGQVIHYRNVPNNYVLCIG